MISIIPNRRPNDEGSVSLKEIHDALDASDISSLGKEILVSLFLNEEAPTEIAARLKMNPSQIKKEKEQAIAIARQCEQLVRLV
jgi:hypothetical protein